MPTMASMRAHLLLSFSRCFDLLALGHLVDLGVHHRLLVLVQVDLRQPPFVVDRHGGPVLDGAADVVDVDVVAEHGACVHVRLFDGGSGEADEGGVGEGVAQVAREAVDEVVLAAVRLVGDHDDVGAVGEQWVAFTALSGMNFWMVVKTTPPEAT